MRKMITPLMIALLLLSAGRAAGDDSDRGMGPIPFSLVISGGISLGAYEAGFNWAIVKYLKEARKRACGNTWPCAAKKSYADLVAITGASAGGVNTILTATHWCMADSVADTVDDNIYRNTWVDVDIESLMPNPEDEEQYCQGDMLLSRKKLRENENEVLKVLNKASFRNNCSVLIGLPFTREEPGVVTIESSKSGSDSTWRTPQYEIPNDRFVLPLKFTVSDKGEPYFRNFTELPGRTKERIGIVMYMQEGQCNPAKVLFPTCRNDGMRRFCTSGTENATKPLAEECVFSEFGTREGACALGALDGSPRFSSPGNAVHPYQVMAAAETTSAFPLAFSKHKLYYCREREKADLEPQDSACPRGYVPERDYFVDGGIFDNIPLEIARHIAESSEIISHEDLARNMKDVDSLRKELTDYIDKSKKATGSNRNAASQKQISSACVINAPASEAAREIDPLSQLNDDILNTACQGAFANVVTDAGLANMTAPYERKIPISYIYIDPDRRRAPNVQRRTYKNRDLMDLWNQVAFLGGAIQTARKYEMFSAQRSGDWGADKSDERRIFLTDRFSPLTGDYLAAFGGFLDPAFMEYDYDVGVHDAIHFIRDSLCKETNTCDLLTAEAALGLEEQEVRSSKAIIDAIECMENNRRSHYDADRDECIRFLPSRAPAGSPDVNNVYLAIMSDKGKDIPFGRFLEELKSQEGFETEEESFLGRMMEAPGQDEWRYFLPIASRGTAHLEYVSREYTDKNGLTAEHLTYSIGGYVARWMDGQHSNTLSFNTLPSDHPTWPEAVMRLLPSELGGNFMLPSRTSYYLGYDMRRYSGIGLNPVDALLFPAFVKLAYVYESRIDRHMKRHAAQLDVYHQFHVVDSVVTLGVGPTLTYSFAGDYDDLAWGVAANVILIDKLRLTWGYRFENGALKDEAGYLNIGVTDFFGLARSIGWSML